LRDYIDAAFEGMMDALALPVPVRYFMCMLDKQVKKWELIMMYFKPGKVNGKAINH